MKKSNAKTSLKITMQPDGGADIELKYDDRDSEHPTEASERLIAELVKTIDYEWLAVLVIPYLSTKYCDKCVYHRNYEFELNKCIEAQNNTPFPYCFKIKNSDVK